MTSIWRTLALACAITGLAVSAEAHAFLKSAEPAVGSSVAAGPTQLRLHYTEGVEAHFSGITVTGPDGQPVAGAKLAADPSDKALLVVTLPAALAPGKYQVEWHATAVDTHKTDGKYGFTVGTAGSGSATPPAGIVLSSAWTRASVGNLGTGIIYLEIANHGKEDDQLVAAETPVAGHAELHRSVNDKGVMEMPPVPDIPVKAGGDVKLEPDGLHIMLTDLKNPLKEGDLFSITLTFAKAKKIDALVHVLGAAALGPTANMDEMDDMEHMEGMEDMKGMDMGGGSK